MSEERAKCPRCGEKGNYHRRSETPNYFVCTNDDCRVWYYGEKTENELDEDGEK